MARKLTITLAVIILSFCCGVCFAEENNSNMNLGDDISNTFNDVESGIEDVANDVMDGEVTTDNNYRNNDDMTDRNYIDSTTNGYNAYRTTTDGTITGTDTTMSTTTWMWVILAIAAIVIIAMIWYYAVQGNDNNRS